MTKPTYTLTLRAESGRWQASPTQRLRALLKAALRGYGLRCVSALEVSANDAPQASVAPAVPTVAHGEAGREASKEFL